MSQFFNIVRMFTSTTGTGTLTLSSNVPPFLSFSSAGVPNGAVVSYTIIDGSNIEVGRGTYSTSGQTLTRGPVGGSSGTSPINLSGNNAQVMISVIAEDVKPLSRIHVPRGAWRVLISKVQSGGEYADLLRFLPYDRSSTLLDPYTNGVILDYGSFGGFPASAPFSGVDAEWASDLQVTNRYWAALGFKMNSGPVDLGSITLKCNGSYLGRAPKDFAIQFSDDGGFTWITYQTHLNEAAWSSGESRTYTLGDFSVNGSIA